MVFIFTTCDLKLLLVKAYSMKCQSVLAFERSNVWVFLILGVLNAKNLAFSILGASAQCSNIDFIEGRKKKTLDRIS